MKCSSCAASRKVLYLVSLTPEKKIRFCERCLPEFWWRMRNGSDRTMAEILDFEKGFTFPLDGVKDAKSTLRQESSQS